MIKQIERAINDLGIVCDPIDHVSISDVVRIIEYLRNAPTTSLNNLKVGDDFGQYGEVVVAVDIQNNVVITDDDGEKSIYYILNPKATASLYSKPVSLIL